MAEVKKTLSTGNGQTKSQTGTKSVSAAPATSKATSGGGGGGKVVVGGYVQPGGTVTSDGVVHDKYIVPHLSSPGDADYPRNTVGSGGSGNGWDQARQRVLQPQARNVNSVSPGSTGYSASAAATNGYIPLGTYNDADLRANQQADPIDRYKAMYEQARLSGDKTGMQQAHALAEQYRAANGSYSGGPDGSLYIPTPQGTAASTWQTGQGFNAMSPASSAASRGIDSQLSETDYNTILTLKAQFAEHDRLYQQAKAAGDTELANYYKNLREQDRYAAETIRNQYGYSGGMTGSDYTGIPQEQDTVARQGLAAYQPQTQAVNSVYDALNDSTMAQLLAAYNNSKAELEYAMGKLPSIYQQQRNVTAANAEQERLAFREQAAASGLNYGNRSQAALAFSNQLQNSLGQLNTAEANALADAQQQLTQLYTAYQQQIAQAVAENNYQRAAALLQEYRTQQESLVNTSLNQANLNLQVADFNRTTHQNNFQNSMDLANSLAGIGSYGSLGSLGGLTDDQISQLQRQYSVSQFGQYYPILRPYL